MLKNSITWLFTGAALLSLAVTPLAGEEVTNKILVQLEAKVGEVLKEARPDAGLKLGDRVLSADYRTQKFMVHNIGMDGEISPKPHEEIGPGAKGFRLSASLVSNSYPEQGLCPRSFKKPHWQGYYDRIALKGTDQDILLVVTFGSRTDTNIIEKLKSCVYRFASENK